MTTEKSPRYSFKNWKFWALIKGNWSTIKELVKLGLPLLCAWFVTHNVITVAGATLLGKFVLDTLHYWVKKK